MSWMEPGQPGRKTSEKSTTHKIVEVTVDGVPTGTAKAAVLMETDVDLHRSPAVVSDCDPASRPSVVASPADRAKDVARAAV
jgi:hypothetical protein